MLIKINGNPKGKQRPRFARGIVFTPKETKDYEKLIAINYKNAKGEKLEGAVKLIVKAYFPVVKKTKKADKLLMLSKIIRPTKKPDIDNIIKIVMDGLNGIAYNDDNQVVEVVALKYYGYEPCVEIEVYTI